jgi:hypothetical protein
MPAHHLLYDNILLTAHCVVLSLSLIRVYCIILDETISRLDHVLVTLQYRHLPEVRIMAPNLLGPRGVAFACERGARREESKSSLVCASHTVAGAGSAALLRRAVVTRKAPPLA